MARAIAALFGLLILGVIAIETAKYVKLHIAPALAPLLATLFTVAASAALLFFLYRVFAGPTQRLAERTRDEIDYRYQLSRAGGELKRRIAAIEEEQRVRALTSSARVHENASRAVSEGQLHLELEELKGRSEEVVMRSQATGIARTLARYQAAFWDLKKAEHMSPTDKARLLEEMRGILADDAISGPSNSGPELGEGELSLGAQPPVVLEYRAQGGHAIPVTAEGFRRLVERGQLRKDDECRRLGSIEWSSVAEVLADDSLL